ncbi:MAG: S8 family peptidase [Flavobacteriales bacterium]|nr:S8 family peptidase [Flavobacteriales bacterium]
MKKSLYSLLVVLLMLSSVVTAFSQISSQLQQALTENAGEYHRIRIEFKNNVDCYALNHEFKQQRTPASERSKMVITQLQDQAKTSQADVLELLNGELEDQVSHIQPFWVVNMIVLEASKDAIEKIADIPEVALIDLENSHILPHDPIIREVESHQRTPNGVESGLVAINAPAVWALGYTGRGRMVYDYDTGVWPTHPAFSERFLAHRYPIDQCWYGYFSDVPNGTVSDHGTHTLGTMTGLVEATNDTIGVAFKAYWIANDFVTSTVEALPPLTDMIGAFEWALNPDGDVNTTEDIPDVINNSWRWRDDPDTVQCGGIVVNLMNAIEAAGIANVFSGGNSGPNNTTVNAPQRINTSEVNTFSVGSVNGNSPFPYPISNFSTIGPTQCPSGGNSALEIHPEVVAPGQNVRSAWGTDGFNTISGTSMAAPHVSGAILLLKEAFPYLSGEELLWALYLTAVDLGDPGEDNVYGRGIIDVYAAFQHLAQTNTPVDPLNVAWDLGLKMIEDPNEKGFTCDGTMNPQVSITNLGDSIITSIDFEYNINAGNLQSFTWTGTLLPAQSITVNLPAILTSDYGDLGLSITASISGIPSEYDLYNNKWYHTINRREPVSLPFIEDFEHGFSQNNWFVNNIDGDMTWEPFQTQGLPWNDYSASIQLFKYTPRNNQRDGLISNELVIPNTSDPVWLLFDVAYQKWTSSISSQDTFTVSVSTDCGANFENEVYRKQADELSTADTVQPNFIPTFEWDWRRDSVSLDDFAGQNILLKFQTVNRKGNNLYIDNVKVFTGSTEPASVVDQIKNELKLFPNPTAGLLNIVSTQTFNPKATVRIYSNVGAEISIDSQISSNRIELRTESLSSGIYFIRISDGKLDERLRFVKL